MTTTWALTTGQWIADAYRRLGILSAGGAPTDDQFERGILAANALLKGCQADGINVYRQTQVAVTVGAMAGQPGTPISVTPLILGLEDARWVVQPAPNLYERPLGIFTYVQYMQLPNKQSASQSGPSLVMFDRQTTASNLYIFPLSQSGGTLNITAARTVNDVTNPNDPIDIPTEWTQGYIWMLADRLMDYEGVANADEVTAQRIQDHSAAFYNTLLNYDRPASVFMKPYGRAGTGRLWRG